MEAAVFALAALCGSLGVLFALDARDRASADGDRRADAVLCAGRDCDIAPSAE